MATVTLRPDPRHHSWPFKRVYAVVGVTLVVLGGVVYVVHRAAAPPTPLRYLSALVRRGALSETASATGEIVPAATDTVTMPRSAHVQQVIVHLGQTVSQGQVLVRLSDPTLVSQMATAHATLLAYQSQVAVDGSVASANALRAQIAQLMDTLQAAQANLARAAAKGQVVAPAAGSVKLAVASGETVSAGQTVVSVDGKAVGAPLAGTVSAIAVANGQRVAAGTVLFRITSSTLSQTVLSDDSQIAGLQLQIDKLKAQQQGASATLAQAQAQVQQSQQAYAAAQQAVGRLTVTAPFAGVVTALNPAASGAGRLLTISSATKVVTVPVPETQITQVRPGEPVQITASAFPGQTFHGSVRSVAPVGLYSNGASTFPVTVAVSGASAIRYGMSAQVNITVRTIPKALLVPLAALHSVGARTAVEVISGTTRHRVPVHILLENATTAAVRARRLTPGDRVITAVLGASSGKLHLKAKGRTLHHARRRGAGKKAR